ncbi:MHYT domain-containing protein [Brevundimonas sp.]|uniref:MHYT domain-containing protein n=1 Tax=Brevundimonas sp. TaxID=1871086 RepID=UPI00180AE321|nr:MHYT domain-containing protein [Brevundimonas sp.]MBA4808907.1 hypothetical protein [Brevundimonas sp.]
MHHHHEPIYLVLASLLAIFGSWTALDLFRRARLHDGTVQAGWIGVAAVAMGVSIWSMHFVAMLGFDPGAPVSYDLGLTVASLALAMAGTAVAFAVCAQPGRSLASLLGSGAIMGLSIGGMHYVGMAALRTSAIVGYQQGWVVASVVVALGASTAALWVARKDYHVRLRVIAAVLLGVGIVSMHYTAMASVTLTPGATPQGEPGVEPLWLAFGVAGLTILVLFLGMGASLLDQRQALLMALRAGRMGYWEMDVVRRRLRLSEEGRRLLGLDPSAPFEQSQVSGLLTPESAEHRARLLEEAIATGSDYTCDYQMLDGRWLEVRGEMLLDGLGKPQRLIGTIQDVTDHRAAFQALSESEKRQRILVNELNHRVKNTLATVLSMAHLTARKAATAESFAASFESRLLALSATHNLLTAQGWERATARNVFEAEFDRFDPDQVTLSGADIWLPSEAVLALGLITHELATNASKYGALSRADGRVRVDWSLGEEGLAVTWRETGGPPVKQPERTGFGSRLVRSTARTVDFRYPKTGFEADFTIQVRQD